ncbi:MAG: NitT/TauT family transport system permease protein [Gammaproteobacteria bacterium]|jgi:NitT/TauT family transport system permease protein
MEQIIDALKTAMPFRMVPQHLLKEIAELCTEQRCVEKEELYSIGDVADDVYIILYGSVEHTLDEESGTNKKINELRAGGVFGWAAVLDGQNTRLAKTVCKEPTVVIRIAGKKLIKLLQSDPQVGDVVMSRFATMINKEFSVSESLASQIPSFTQALKANSLQTSEISGMSLTVYRIASWIKSPRPYLMIMGFIILLGTWYLTVEVWKLPRFEDMPGLTEVFTEWFSKDPYYGLSIYTPEYYTHIWISLRRIAFAFFLATALGVPLGLFLGWSKSFREFIFPLFEVLRPIPVLAWVPLAIIIFSGSETPVIFLTFLASFFATTLNTMLGVESIDESYSRAARCLGASRWQTFRHVVIPGAMPYIFTGLQISIGVAWFSLVAGEMVSGQYGLGYLINTAYMMIEYPKIIIGMITLGVVGYSTSAMVRVAGDYLMQWRVRELALGDN